MKNIKKILTSDELNGDISSVDNKTFEELFICLAYSTISVVSAAKTTTHPSSEIHLVICAIIYLC
mgnify:CR=1 FL=1